MLSLAGGLAVFLLTVIMFRRSMPVNGQVHRLMGTYWEPYVATVFCAGFALGTAMLIYGILSLLGRV